jgi:tetratricopeptide (TPR) repeat protein
MADTSAVFERITSWLDGLRKAVISLGITIAVGILVVVVIREVYREGIAIDPVIIQVASASDAPKPELAAQQIAKNIDLVQRAGLSEWRKLYVDQAPSPIDLQIPGAPLTLRTGIREIAELFGISRSTIRVTIVSRKEPDGYLASITLANDHSVQATCQADLVANAMDKLFECIALKAMTMIDPKVAAAYVFQDEERRCGSLDAGQSLGAGPLAREERRIVNRRQRCEFEGTQQLIVKVVERGRAEDLPWVPYISGKVHLARAKALAGIDWPQQLGELDQAIGRFADSVNRLPNSATAVAVLIDAYVQKGISIHEATAGLPWSDDRKSLLQWQLDIAQSTFAEASDRLTSMQLRGSDPNLRALVRRLEGVLYYRQWMLMAHRRNRSGTLDVAIGQPDELVMLKQANESYEAAASAAPQPASVYVDWGNVLRAAGSFDAAVDKYAHAADLRPDMSAPKLNMTIAFLDRVGYGAARAEPIHVLVALGASSDYLSWVSDGGPYPNIIAKIEKALAHTGDPSDAEAFKACMLETASEPGTPGEPEVDRWKPAAALKICIDRAIDLINKRGREAPRPVAAAPRAKAR